jgi:hypothetical protein
MNPPADKKSMIFFIAAALLALLTAFFYLSKGCESQSGRTLSPYFSYSAEELKPLAGLKSSAEITPDDLISWEEKAFERVGQTKSDATLASKFYAYLFTAQRDFASLSSQTQGRFWGDIGVVSREVTCLFFPESCSKLLSDEPDRYSKAIADLVLAKVKQRMEQDKKTARSYEIKEGDPFWKGIGTFKGIDTGSWKTWLVQSGSQFRLPPPAGYGSPEDQKQLQAVKDIFQHLTDKQKKAIAFWATGPGTKTAPGMWLKFASDAMQESSMRLEKILLLRSVLAMILADTEIAAMDSKYTYWVKRPFMRDNTILTFMPTPNHPSYPSEHAAIVGAGAAFLETFFPQQKERWAALSREATNSRIWSGIHFPMDAEQGLALGREIAEKVLQDVSQTR